MNKKQLLDIVIFPLFVTVITFVGILSILSTFALDYLYSTQHNMFDDYIISFDFLWLVPALTLVLILILFFLIMIRQDDIKFRKKGDDKN